MFLDCVFVHPKTHTRASYRIYSVDANGLFRTVQDHGPAGADRLASALIKEKVPMWLQANYTLQSYGFVDEAAARGVA